MGRASGTRVRNALDPTVARALRLWLLGLGIAGATIAAIAALVALLVHAERADWLLYAGGLGVVMPLSLWVAWWLERGAPSHAAKVAVMLAAGLAALLVLSRVLYGLGAVDEASSWLLLAGSLALLAALVPPPKSAGSSPNRAQMGEVENWQVPLATAALFGAALLVFAPPDDLGAGNLALSLLIAAVVTVAYLRWRPVALSADLLFAADVVAVLLILLAAVDITGYVEHSAEFLGTTLPDPFGSEIALHQDFYLGPVNDVLGGRALLVDSASQYGIGSIYLLVAWFKLAPLGYGALQVFVGLLTGIQYALAYALMRLGGCGRLLAAAASFVAVAVTLLASAANPAFYPSQSGLRFLLPFMAAVLALVAARRPTPAISVSVIAVTALASIWSVETFVYTGAAVVAIAAVDAFTRTDSPGNAARVLGRDLVRLAAACLAAHLVFLLATRILAGDWPDYGWYLEFFSRYSAQGFQTVLVGPWSPGWFICGFCFASLAGVVALLAFAPGAARRHRVPLLAIAASTAAGLGLLSYWVGRSLDLTLTILSLPAVVAAALWLALILGSAVVRPPGRVAAVAVFAWVAGLLVVAAWPVTSREWPRTALAHALPGGGSFKGDLERLWDSPVIDSRAAEAQRLIEQRFPDTGEALVLVEPDLGTEALIRSHRVNLLPIGDPAEDTVAIDNALPRVRDAILDLAAGTLMLIQHHPDGPLGPELTSAVQIHRESRLLGPANWLVPLQLRALEMIRGRFELRAVASGLHGLTVVRLTGRKDLQ